ncbi:MULTISPECIES: hypothetical protein [unclassified Pseudomonas]|uniref:hypothetical protein n=1 Tax=unclassified Pseudomonas TaxID=196821 RepID=UPI000CD2C941|nr:MULTISPECIES: hypothetical protein [unclassified Pseudomonas]POA26376.1 hypothetical protein C1895_06140 [Pseudomonas sp. FW305-3-2-15-E-TSA4]POA44635.1 hypothetical protein C1894_04720 [Pseudomonas sp. FW305-3-2-15-E-TSA2]
MSNVKERPILFSAPMVRAILDGRKTVTRRPVKGLSTCFAVTTAADESPLNSVCWNVGGPIIRCPYGKPGDRLWVRESGIYSKLLSPEDPTQPGTFRHDVPRTPELGYWWIQSTRAPGARYSVSGNPRRVDKARGQKAVPSIHMPRWASRILLEITDVRVERLQDISEEQAQAEGCFFTDYGRKCGHGGKGWSEVGDCPAPTEHHPQREGWMWAETISHEQCLGSARNAFGNLWNTTGGDWDANPWVWVVEFKRVQP